MPNIWRGNSRSLYIIRYMAIMLCLTRTRLRGKLIIRTNEMDILYKSDNYTKMYIIRNWEFQNMWNGMCTIEMIENLKIKIRPNLGVCHFAVSPTIYTMYMYIA